MPNIYENDTKEDLELVVASQATEPIYYPQIIGQFASGSLQDYGNPRVKEVHVAPGQSIQAAIEAIRQGGGGIVRLQRGTHIISENLTLYSNISLVGEGKDITIIDFETATQIKVQGTRRDSDNIDLSEGGTSITTTGTFATTIVPGDFILIRGFWYEISVRVSATELTLKNTFQESTIVEADADSLAYIANTIKNVSLADFTILDGGLNIDDADNIIIRNIKIDGGSVGLNASTISRGVAENVEIFRNTGATSDGFNWTDGGYFEVRNCVSSYNGRDGFRTDNSEIVMIFSHCFARGNTAAGFTIGSGLYNIDNCRAEENDGVGFSIIASTGGIELSNCVASTNDGDGFDLSVRDRFSITECRAESNGGFGIDIAAACDNTLIENCFLVSNTSGAIRDAGTNTMYVNQGTGTFTAVNGANNNIDIGEQRYTRISGPTLAYSISGITNTANAKRVTLFNTVAQDMTLTNQATSDDTQQILTLTGADVTLTGISLANLIYDATSKKWVLLGTQG